MIEEERPSAGFDGVRLDAEGQVLLTQGEPERLVIEAEDNMAHELRTTVIGGKLVIRTRRGVELEPTLPITYHLWAADIRSIDIDGSGSVFGGELTSDDLRLSIDGSGEIGLEKVRAGTVSMGIDGSGSVVLPDLQASVVQASVDGSGDIELIGWVDVEHVDIDGSGTYTALELRARSGRVGISGSGDVTACMSPTSSAPTSAAVGMSSREASRACRVACAAVARYDG
jgi:hypothetical protein